MIRVATERISELFALAELEASRGNTMLPDRYVQLARRIGMRYNVRLLPEFRELYCRGCSSFWVEGRTVRTRLRAGRRLRTCLRCGRHRRVVISESRGTRSDPMPENRPRGSSREAVLADEGREDGDELGDDEGEEG